MQIDLLPGIDLGLAIQRKMITIFVDQDVRQQPGARAATWDGAARQWGLRERFTARTCSAGAHDLADDKAPGDVFEFRCHILAQWAQRTAAGRAGVARRQDFCLPLQMLGQRGAVVLAFVWGLISWDWLRVWVRRNRRNGPIFFKIQRQLIAAFGFRAKPCLTVTCELVLKLFDFQRLRFCQVPQLRSDDTQFVGIIGQVFRCLQHCPKWTSKLSTREV